MVSNFPSSCRVDSEGVNMPIFFDLIFIFLLILLQWLITLLLNPWQSYVLDVHPFNPRIAMSAGYDGRTIVWDVSLCFLKFSLQFYFYYCYFHCVLKFCGMAFPDMGGHAYSDI